MAIKVEVYIWREGEPLPGPADLFDEVEVPDSGWLPQVGDTIHLADRKGDGSVYALEVVRRDLLFGWSGEKDTPIPLTQWCVYGRPLDDRFTMRPSSGVWHASKDTRGWFSVGFVENELFVVPSLKIGINEAGGTPEYQVELLRQALRWTAEILCDTPVDEVLRRIRENVSWD